MKNPHCKSQCGFSFLCFCLWFAIIKVTGDDNMKKLFLILISMLIAVIMSFSGCSQADSDKEIAGEKLSLTEQESVTKVEPYEVVVPFGDYVSRFNFDENGRLISQTNPGTNTDTKLISYAYDGNGNCISISMYNKDDAVFAEKNFTYDSSGNCTQETAYEFVDGERVFDFSYTYERDSSGKIIKIINDKGTTEAYSYDENGLCISEDTFGSDGTIVSQAKFYYDADGRLIRTDSTEEDWNYEYDSSGRLIKETNYRYHIEYEYREDGTVNIYTLSDLYEKTPSLTMEYYDNGKIVKCTWYGEGTEIDEVYIALVEELTANEPDPTVLKYF